MGSRPQRACSGPDDSDPARVAQHTEVATPAPSGMGMPQVWHRAQSGYEVLLLLDPYLVHHFNKHWMFLRRNLL